VQQHDCCYWANNI